MKNLSKYIATLVMLVISSIGFAQNNSVQIKVETLDEGVRITTIENGKSSSAIFNLADAQKYLEELADDIEINIEEEDENVYQIKYKTDAGTSETVEIDVDEMMKNLDINLENLGEDFQELIEKVSSQVEYEETVDENGNKVIKIKTVETK